MSTHFSGEGNIGSAPEYREFPNGNEEPRRLLRLNVYFDNPVPTKDGYEDRGGFWAPVELWHRDAEHWQTLYQKGMRILVDGRTVRDEWEDADEERTRDVQDRSTACRYPAVPARCRDAKREGTGGRTRPR
jgi:single-strand DNA-binding protein